MKGPAEVRIGEDDPRKGLYCEGCLFFEDWTDGSHRCAESLLSLQAPFKRNHPCSHYVDRDTGKTLLEIVRCRIEDRERETYEELCERAKERGA